VPLVTFPTLVLLPPFIPTFAHLLTYYRCRKENQTNTKQEK